MQQGQLNTFSTGRRVQGFLETQAAVIGVAVPPGLRAKLDAAVNQLVAAQLEQGNSQAIIRGEVASQAAIRKDINGRLLRPIARAAKFELPEVADYDALIVPSAVIAKGAFVSKVNLLADAAAKYEQRFINNMIPADFIAQLRVAVAQLSASAESQARHQSRLSASTAGVFAAEKAIRAVVGMLDAGLTPLIKSNPELLADWIASKRIVQTTINPNATGSVSAADGSADEPAEPETPDTAA